MRQIDVILNLMKPQLSDEQYHSLSNVLEAVLTPTKADKSNEAVIAAYVRYMKYKEYTNSTIERYLISINQFAQAINCPLIEVDYYVAQDFIINYKEERHLKARSMNTLITYLSALYNFLEKEEWIMHNPFNKIDKVKEPKEKKVAFTDQEIEQLRQACTNKRDRALLEFLLSTGCRRSEAANLQINQIDFNNKTAFIKAGKGRKDRLINFDDTTKQYLEDYLTDRNNNSPFLFNKIRQAEPISPASISGIIQELGKKANVEDCHPHKFRRTCITELVRGGMQPVLVAQQAGHSSISTTLNIYTEVKDDEVREAYHQIKKDQV